MFIYNFQRSDDLCLKISLMLPPLCRVLTESAYRKCVPKVLTESAYRKSAYRKCLPKVLTEIVLMLFLLAECLPKDALFDSTTPTARAISRPSLAFRFSTLLIQITLQI